ncbi:hypothetical protein GCM10010193_08800 [Kitasatospora atroaurantiaca]|uniref:Uncharacterized protein n=1 Tax=Kitasatospora atroaurantiaca TaxID=285545 RepID=A0A561ERV2_9ACTN|nr:DUF6087 family protein [Kitasatospora atroaurantiaca]TWE18336.1 hypothetical protein FB465_3403 [Kitasatospora atroaurantiaca]
MLEPDDETVSDWYAARADGNRPPGVRDALTLDPTVQRGCLFQDTPRLVVEWDGQAWQPVGVADTYADAYPVIVRRGSDFAAPQEDTPVALLRKGRGRHRRS